MKYDYINSNLKFKNTEKNITSDNGSKYGTVFIVGAGPGDIKLMTLKAYECIKNADTIIYDDLINPSLLNEAVHGCELIYAGKRNGVHAMEQDEINNLLIKKAFEGKMTVRLKGGDPFLFGRGSEEAQALKNAGIEYAVVPGVSSALSVPSSAGIPLTDRRYASQVHIITARRGKYIKYDSKSVKHIKGYDISDYAALSKLEGTLVFLMSFNVIDEITNGLIDAGKPKETPIAVISNGSMQGQRKCISTLKDINVKIKAEKITTPAIIVIGEVVELSYELDNFMQEYKKRPLFGKKILITASRYMASRLNKILDNYGAETVVISLIETIPLYTERFYRAMEELSSYTWLVFTSSNGINIFFDELTGIEDETESGMPFNDIKDSYKYPLDLRNLGDIKIAVIGSGSASTLRKHGFNPDFVPKSYSLKALSQGLVKMLTEKDRVLILRAEEAGSDINEIFTLNNINFSDIPVYRTVKAQTRKDELKRILPLCDYVCLCSSMGARAYFEMTADKTSEKNSFKENEDKPAENNIISIGPVTTQTCVNYGITPFAQAYPFNSEGIAKCLCSLVCSGI
ncbi:uroporphyrinogen-III C-methyltransferase [Johnsonella ignava]|uniref:uroporphyrinogen-III C-methyltransferase n=1 Tax=Johnsonella ignava TaxID=43995 RepID=UPI0023EF8B3A|nr:uroporphyrinogen-III C-methyltransferase [Johnsonella ignava]